MHFPKTHLVFARPRQRAHIPRPANSWRFDRVEKESPIHLSNIALLNPATKKADRVGFKTLEAKNAGEKPRKVRYFKSNNELVDVV